jgi:hypothetical protein
MLYRLSYRLTLARITHEYLLRRPILSRGCPLLFKLQWAIGFSPRRTDDPLHLREQQVPRFGLSRLATASMGNPDLPRALSRTLSHCLKSVQERATLTRPGERRTAGGT